MRLSRPQICVRRGLAMCVLLLWPLLCTAAEQAEKAKETWLVVTRPMFVPAIKPLVFKRIRDGFDK